jgi:long-subunit acyl-CoA synthetase (AMP-forming)
MLWSVRRSDRAGERSGRFAAVAAISMSTVQGEPQAGPSSASGLVITFRELWDCADAATTAMANKPLRSGDRVCVLGDTSIDYTITDLALIRLDAVSVPLHTNTPLARLRRIVAETKPSVIASSIDHLPKAVELALRPVRPPGWSCSITTPRSISSARFSMPASRGWRTHAQS